MAIKKAKISKESRKGFDWVKIFLRPDAVADAMAAELKVDKSEVLSDKDGKKSMVSVLSTFGSIVPMGFDKIFHLL